MNKLAIRPLLPLLVAVLAIGLMLSGGIPTAHAGGPTPDCDQVDGLVCISLDPSTDTNAVGDDHTVTATVTFEPSGNPISGIPVVILVFKGPNAGASTSTIGLTDGNGQLDLTYTGAGGTGTDSIVALACFLLEFETCAGFFEQVVILACIPEPEICIAGLEGFCLELEIFLCDDATKDWVAPTPTPTPTTTPTPTPTPMPTPITIGSRT